MKKFVFYFTLVIFLSTSCSPAQPIPTHTPSPTVTSTPQPGPTATIPPTATVTPTVTPVPLRIVFKEDFSSDPLGWQSMYQNPYYDDLRFSYGREGLEFQYNGPRSYTYDHKRPQRIIVLEGDFDLDVVFDRRVRFSGPRFSNGTLENAFEIMIAEALSWNNWEREDAHLGFFRASHEQYEALGKIEKFLPANEGDIHLHISFRGNRIRASVNDSPIISDVDPLYSGRKYFMGFAIGNGDHFIVKDLQFWVSNPEDFEIVEAVQIGWQESAPMFDAWLSRTPTSTTDPTAPAPTVSQTIDSFVGVWRNVQEGSDSGTAMIQIKKENDLLLVHPFGSCCNGSCYCDMGTSSVVFESSPVVFLVDFGFIVEKITLAREGNLLHMTIFGYYIDGSNRKDYIRDEYFRK